MTSGKSGLRAFCRRLIGDQAGTAAIEFGEPFDEHGVHGEHQGRVAPFIVREMVIGPLHRHFLHSTSDDDA